MTLLLFILAGVWAAVLLPPYFRNRNDRPSDSILSFRQQLSTLERTRPGSRPRYVGAPIAIRSNTPMPAGRSAARRRRRDILFTLAGAVGITFVLAVLLGGVAILCLLAAVAALGGYVFLLVQMRKTEAERIAKVSYLPVKTESAEPALLLNRTASN